MKIIKTYDGERTKSGWHTGFALVEQNGKLYICSERGTRPATTKEVIEHYEKDELYHSLKRFVGEE